MNITVQWLLMLANPTLLIQLYYYIPSGMITLKCRS